LFRVTISLPAELADAPQQATPLEQSAGNGELAPIKEARA
jgi:hypothetical protein